MTIKLKKKNIIYKEKLFYNNLELQSNIISIR